MPIYEAQCVRCGDYHNYFATVDTRGETPICCGLPTSKVIVTAPSLGLDIPPWDAYESPATGRMITSNAERKRDLAESGCRPYEGAEQERKESQRQASYKVEAEDKELTKTIEQSFRELPESLKAATIA